MINVAVIFGGKSVEHEVSVITGLQALHALDKSRYNPIPLYIAKDESFYTGENSREIYKQAPAKTMNIVYLMYHTMSPEMAIDRLKEAYASEETY